VIFRGLVLAVTVACATVALAAPGAPEEALERGRVAYERGAYREALEIVRPLLYPSIELASEEAVIDAHRLLALAHLFNKQEPEAEEEVKALLALRPTYELDPVVDPPVAVRFFQNVRARQDARLAELKRREAEERAAREREAAERRKAQATFFERGYRVNSRLVAALPFGIGQFQNGNRYLGIFFATTQALAAALSIGCWAGIEAKWGNTPVPKSDTAAANAVQNTQLAAGAVFWGLYLAGLIDAEVRFKPRVDVEEREVPGTKPKRMKVSVVPSILIAPGLYGLGAGGVF
jgi:hypothetical protein